MPRLRWVCCPNNICTHTYTRTVTQLITTWIMKWILNYRLPGHRTVRYSRRTLRYSMANQQSSSYIWCSCHVWFVMRSPRISHSYRNYYLCGYNWFVFHLRPSSANATHIMWLALDRISAICIWERGDTEKKKMNTYSPFMRVPQSVALTESQ